MRYLISFENIRLQYFAILLDHNVIVAMQYLKIVLIKKKFFKGKRLPNQTIRFVFEKLLNKWGSTISGSLVLIRLMKLPL